MLGEPEIKKDFYHHCKVDKTRIQTNKHSQPEVDTLSNMGSQESWGHLSRMTYKEHYCRKAIS